MKIPSFCIVDTNVPLTANGAASHASEHCRDRCMDVLLEIMENGRIALDHRGLILEEYRRKLSYGFPNVGDEFVKWAHDHEWNVERCYRGVITPRGRHGDCMEFPTAPTLEKFDLSDRKFAAVASVAQAPILNACDSDWKNHEPALAEAGIRVIFLCPDEPVKLAEEKAKRERRTAQVSKNPAPLLAGPDPGQGRQGAHARRSRGVSRRRGGR